MASVAMYCSQSSRVRGLCAAALLLVSAQVAAVELARVEGFGPISRGFAGAGVAHAVGAAAVLLNPAELLDLESPREFSVQLTELHATIEVINSSSGEKVANASLGNNRGPYDLPEIVFAMRRGDWAFGGGVFAAGGFGIEYGTKSFLSSTTTNNVATGLQVSSRLNALRIPLAVAWRPSPRWRLGASLDVINGSLNLADLLDVQQVGLLIQSGRATGTLVPALAAIPNLSGAHLSFVRNNFLSSELSSWGVAGRLGASYQLAESTSLALAYEFKSALADLKGHGVLTAVDASNNQIPIAGSGRLPRLQFPQAWIVGVSQRLSPSLAVVADLRHTLWSEVLGNVDIAFRSTDGGTLNVSLPTGFRDLTTLAIGVEWKFLPAWTLRAGGSHVFQQLVAGSSLNGAFPTLTREHVATTLAWHPAPRHEFDLGASYGFTEPVHNPGGNVNSIPAIEGRNRQVNPVLGYRYQF